MNTDEDQFNRDLSTFLVLAAIELSEEQVTKLRDSLCDIRRQRPDISVAEAFKIVCAVTKGNLVDAEIVVENAEKRVAEADAGARRARNQGDSYVRIQACLVPLKRLVALHPDCGSVEEVLTAADMTWKDFGLSTEDVPLLYELWAANEAAR